jgi:hypothetical protein
MAGKGIWVYFLVGQVFVCFPHDLGSLWTQPASNPVSIDGSFPREKRLGREADNSPPSNAEFNAWSYTFILPLISGVFRN